MNCMVSSKVPALDGRFISSRRSVLYHVFIGLFNVVINCFTGTEVISEFLLLFMFLIRKLLGFPLNKFDYTLENTTCIISV